ncbi:hypothetical protein E1B28_006042 [Marasmius oreades]|uniref:Uncharacterized protein n=1 Tax=Marasmius oreades TaxID=181124 RepID=A0A9P7UWB0_9AGAR|nr:uncharacterized protein E1B28_006042 [Marasmius oreades]KAG7095269.1 hypothetical protein E1B28_006042 [Marasmius oreades]
MDVPPLRLPRLISLFLALSWGIIAGSVGLNALIKSNQSKSKLRRLLPANTRLDVDTDDAFQSGVVITTVSALIVVLCTIYIVLLGSSFSKNPRLARVSKASDSILFIQWVTLAFCAAWLFATQIPFTVFFANNSAKVRASIGSFTFSQDEITVFERLLGVSPVYRNIDYLRLLAILPWFTILFTAIAAVICFLASRRMGTVVDSLNKGKPEESAQTSQ